LEAKTGGLADTTVVKFDNFDLDNTIGNRKFGPYTNFSGDPRDKEGLMHFTKDQVDAINMFLRV
jgi:hypothetical protein